VAVFCPVKGFIPSSFVIVHHGKKFTILGFTVPKVYDFRVDSSKQLHQLSKMGQYSTFIIDDI
jgi:hypothetical protein